MTLKYINADEIASNMINIMGNSDFQAIHKKASFNKRAEDEKLDLLTDAVNEFDDDEGFEDIPNEDIEIEEDEGLSEEVFEKELLDDEEEETDEDLDEEIRKYDKGELPWQQEQIHDEMMNDQRGSPEEWMADDIATRAALKFTKQNLVKISNLLDQKGFAGIANVIDQTIVKLANENSNFMRTINNYVRQVEGYFPEFKNSFDLAPLDESSSPQEIIDNMQSISNVHGKVQIEKGNDINFKKIIVPAYKMVLKTYKLRLDEAKGFVQMDEYDIDKGEKWRPVVNYDAPKDPLLDKRLKGRYF